jgi:hypothetical protein
VNEQEVPLPDDTSPDDVHEPIADGDDLPDDVPDGDISESEPEEEPQ